MRVGVFIFKDNAEEILLVHRVKELKDYYVVPGGGSNPGESEEETAVREAKEETDLDIILGKKVGEFESTVDNRKHAYYLVTSWSGVPAVLGEERDRSSANNQYMLEWANRSMIYSLPLYPSEVKDMIEGVFMHREKK